MILSQGHTSEGSYILVGFPLLNSVDKVGYNKLLLFYDFSTAMRTVFPKLHLKTFI